MKWATFAQSVRPVQRPKMRCRPNLEALEDRTLLSAVDFQEVQSQSPLVLSGTIGGTNIQQQGVNALNTTYFGDFRADVEEANGTIRFIATGNDFCAANTGNWAPRADGSSGTATAIYGLQATLGGTTWLAALRDFHMNADTSGSALALYPNGSGSFGFASAQSVAISAGSGTYSYNGGSGGINLGGLHALNRAGDGTLVDNGSSLRVTVPIDVTVNTIIGGQAAVLHIQGTIVGNATIPIVHLGSGSSPNDFATHVVATQGPVHIADPAATITDASGGTHLISMTATLTNRPDGAQEFLAANVSGTGLTASYNAATGVETISGSALPAVYQSVLRTLTYENDASTPHTYDRIITVAVRDDGGNGGSSSAVRTSTVTVYAPARSFAVTASPSFVTAGAAFTVTVAALDGNGNVAPGYTGTVHLGSADPYGATLPADYTFTAADAGTHTFVRTSALYTAGTWDVTATDGGGITGSVFVYVQAASAVNFYVVAPSSAAAGSAFDLLVVALDAYGNIDTNYAGTVTFSTTDPGSGAVLPTTYTFQPGDAGLVYFAAGVTLTTPGTWTITVTDTTGTIVGGVDVTIV